MFLKGSGLQGLFKSIIDPAKNCSLISYFLRGLASLAKFLGLYRISLYFYRLMEQRGELVGVSLSKASKLAFKQRSWYLSFKYAKRDIHSGSCSKELLDVAVKAGWANQQENAVSFANRALLAKPHLVGWPRMHAGIVLTANGSFSKGCEVMSQCLRTQDDALKNLVSQSSERAERELVYLAPDAGVGSSIVQALPILLAPDNYKNIILVVDQRLHTVFSRVMSSDVVFKESSFSGVDGVFNVNTGYDLLASSMITSQKINQVLIQADTSKARNCLARYNKKFSGKRLIGLAWHTPNPRTGRYRNINLSDLREFINNYPDCIFISLQPVLEQAHRDKRKIQCSNLFVDDEINPIESIEDQLAQIVALDHVVTIDCTAAFFAGALGKPCDVLLSGEPTWQWPEGESLFANQNVSKSINTILL